MVFDDSGYFLIFGSLKGIKIVNVFTNKVTKVVGMGESGERFLCVALYQGVPKVDNQFLLSKAGSDSSKPIDHSAEVLPDPTLYCSAFKKQCAAFIFLSFTLSWISSSIFCSINSTLGVESTVSFLIR